MSETYQSRTVKKNLHVLRDCMHLADIVKGFGAVVDARPKTDVAGYSELAKKTTNGRWCV